MTKEESIINVLNCPCTIADMENYRRIIHKTINEKTNLLTIAINARKIVMFNKNPEFKAIFKENNVLPVPDGIGATVPMRMFNKIKSGKIDFPGFMFDFCDKNNIRCFFLGTTESNNKKAVEKIEKTYSGIQISGRHSGFNINEDKLRDDWLKSETQVVFVAMGSPRQELFSAKLTKNSSGIIFVGVGGRFDILSGEKKRAPELVIFLGLEWAYRFFIEPRRITQNYRILMAYLSLFIKGYYAQYD